MVLTSPDPKYLPRRERIELVCHLNLESVTYGVPMVLLSLSTSGVTFVYLQIVWQSYIQYVYQLFSANLNL